LHIYHIFFYTLERERGKEGGEGRRVLATSKNSFCKANEKMESVREFTQCSNTCAIASVDPMSGVVPGEVKNYNL
jgi:hypothetical protein